MWSKLDNIVDGINVFLEATLLSIVQLISQDIISWGVFWRAGWRGDHTVSESGAGLSSSSSLKFSDEQGGAVTTLHWFRARTRIIIIIITEVFWSAGWRGGQTVSGPGPPRRVWRHSARNLLLEAPREEESWCRRVCRQPGGSREYVVIKEN